MELCILKIANFTFSARTVHQMHTCLSAVSRTRFSREMHAQICIALHISLNIVHASSKTTIKSNMGSFWRSYSKMTSYISIFPRLKLMTQELRDISSGLATRSLGLSSDIWFSVGCTPKSLPELVAHTLPIAGVAKVGILAIFEYLTY